MQALSADEPGTGRHNAPRTLRRVLMMVRSCVASHQCWLLLLPAGASWCTQCPGGHTAALRYTPHRFGQRTSHTILPMKAGSRTRLLCPPPLPNQLFSNSHSHCLQALHTHALAPGVKGAPTCFNKHSALDSLGGQLSLCRMKLRARLAASRSSGSSFASCRSSRIAHDGTKSVTLPPRSVPMMFSRFSYLQCFGALREKTEAARTREV